MGMLQADLADQVGVSRSSISFYENGKVYPDVQTLMRISDALQVTVAQLTEGLPCDGNSDRHSEPRDLHALPLVESWDGTWPLSSTSQQLYVHADIAPHRDCFLIRMADQSMHPYLFENDMLVIDPRARRPRSLEIVVVQTGDELLVRQIKRTRTRISLVAPRQRIDFVVNSPDLKVLGKVVGIAERAFSRPLQWKLRMSATSWLRTRPEAGG
jgi:transcriptional regulator with XRE-family HTH domain